MELPISPGGPGLAAGTLVTTPDGDKKIEEVVAGDLVLSGVGKNLTHFYEVKQAMVKLYNGPIFHITTVSGRQFRATPNHICFAYSKNISPPKDDSYSSYFDNFNIETGVIEHSFHMLESFPSDEGEDEYSVSFDKAKEEVILSYPYIECEVQEFANFVRHKAFRFTPVSKLGVRMKIPTLGEIYIRKIIAKNREYVSSSAIKSMVEEKYYGLIYNLNVLESRNFAANGILVHDSTKFE